MSRCHANEEDHAGTAATGTEDPVSSRDAPTREESIDIILSFDVEEHFRIEAAARLEISPALKAHHGERVAPACRWLLDRLEEREIKATFFVVGQVVRRDPELVRALHRAGHEVASHGWDHRRVLDMTPDSFREDLMRPG